MTQIAIKDLNFTDPAFVTASQLQGGNSPYSVSVYASYSTDKDADYTTGYIVTKQGKSYGSYWTAGHASAIASGVAGAIAVKGYTFAYVNTTASASA